VAFGAVFVSGETVMADEQPELMQAFFTKGVFRGTSPACVAVHDFAPSEFAGKSVAYTCACGRSFAVVPLGLRAGVRKAVDLPGILFGKPGKSLLKIPCRLHDMSSKGAGITLNLTSAEMADTMQLRVKLDDPQQTTLLLPCRVCRRQTTGGQLLLGLEFKQLDLDTQSVLVHYLSQ